MSCTEGKRVVKTFTRRYLFILKIKHLLLISLVEFLINTKYPPPVPKKSLILILLKIKEKMLFISITLFHVLSHSSDEEKITYLRHDNKSYLQTKSRQIQYNYCTYYRHINTLIIEVFPYNRYNSLTYVMKYFRMYLIFIYGGGFN